jgi:glycine oxidase
MYDYLIVGSGLAGICFAETCFQNDKSCIVFENFSQNSSTIAGGIYNPVILKRFSEVWKATEQLDYLNIFYPILENRLNTVFDFKLPVLRKFFSIEEQNNWFSASDQSNLTSFLSQNLVKTTFSGIDSPYNFGEVLHTGYVDTALLLKIFHTFLLDKNLLIKKQFEYNRIQFFEDYISYGNIKAKNIIFAEGFGLHENPFFNYLPLDGTKGELLIIKCPNLDLNCILNSSIFMLPLGDNLFKVGATYDWNSKTNSISEEGKNELLEKIKQLLNCDFEVINHFAGIRPTVRDRRPLLGTHPKYKKLHVLNGLGTRGVMLGPSLAKDLFLNIEKNIPFDNEQNIERYAKLS